MEETQAPLSNNTVVAPKPRRSSIFRAAYVLVVVLLAAVAGVYLWQHHKYTTAMSLADTTNRQLDSTNKKLQNASALVTNLTKQLSDMSTKNKQLASEVNLATSSSNTNLPPAMTQADLNLTVEGAEYVNPDGTVTQGGNWFGVKFTLKNTTSSTINVSNNSFKLQDAQGNQYPEETITGASTLPTNWVSLNNPTLAPGATVSGVITFIMPNTTIKNFTFSNDTKSYLVTSAN